MHAKMMSGWILLISCVLSSLFLLASCRREYDMDKLADCGRTIRVDDSGVILNGRGKISPSNPPLTCIIYLFSVYTRDDGSNKLQIEVQSLNIKDSAIAVDIFEGRKSLGNYIKRLSYRKGSTGVIYSNTNEITIRLTRPQTLYHTEYGFSLLIKAWKDGNVVGSKENDDKVLSVGAIIGIVIGCLILIVLIILFCWCCCTGRVSGIEGMFPRNGKTEKYGAPSPHVSKTPVTSENGKPGLINFDNPDVWRTVTSGTNNRQGSGRRYFQRGIPRNRLGSGGAYENTNVQGDRDHGQDNDNYCNSKQHRVNSNPNTDYEEYQHTRMEKKPLQARKETLIDDVFDSDSGTAAGETTDTNSNDITLQMRPPGEDKRKSPKTKRKDDVPIPEENNLDGSPHLERYRSMDLQSQPDLDTIGSPLHINAGVRATVEDDYVIPMVSLQKPRKGGKSPKSKRRGEHEPDQTPMPPEAFEPIFSSPPTGLDYPGNRNQMPYGAGPPAYSGTFVPYGMIPSFPHMGVAAPGTQTYAYAYQTVPPGGIGGQPAAQGAWIVQNTPTTDGNRRTAFAVEHTLSPDKSVAEFSPKGRRKKSSDPFKRNDHRNSGNSNIAIARSKDQDLDLSVITRGAAPPDPGQGHRSVAMKSGTDPDNGIQTTQVVWTDTVPDKTDPKPGDNPQITRKTVTRVTTKSGHGELPPETNPLLALDEAEPAFLSPSSGRAPKAITPNASGPVMHTPDHENITFYTGVGSNAAPPERSSTPVSMHHQATPYSRAIRDRIPLDESTI